MKVSFCTTCMGRTHHLQVTLPRNLADSADLAARGEVEFVVMDYSSADGLADWLHTDPQIAPWLHRGIVRYVRIDGECYFRHSRAKNFAHAHATGQVLCNLDADNFTGPGFAAWLQRRFVRTPHAIVATNRLDARLNSGAFKGSMGRIALSAEDFWRLGGYDESERFRGWSAEDTDLLLRAVRSGLRPVLLRDRRFLHVIEHSDLERVALTQYSDLETELARVRALDGSRLLPVLGYLVDRALAPRVANRAG